MGFIVGKPGSPCLTNPDYTAFVLDRHQCQELAAYLDTQLVGLKQPLGRGSSEYTFSWIRLPELRLQNELETAAMKAHPGWRQLHKTDKRDRDFDPAGFDWEQEPGTPSGARLIKWFKRTHPRKAQRIERDFTRRLWAGQL